MLHSKPARLFHGLSASHGPRLGAGDGYGALVGEVEGAVVGECGVISGDGPMLAASLKALVFNVFFGGWYGNANTRAIKVRTTTAASKNGETEFPLLKRA